MSKSSFFHILNPPDEGRITLQLCGYSHVEHWQYMERAHPFWVLYWNRQEGAFLMTEEKTIPMKEESCYLIPPYTCFSTDNRKGFDHFYCHFKVSGEFERVQRKIYAFPADLLREKFIRLTEHPGNGREFFLLQEIFLHYLLQIDDASFLEHEHSRLDPGIALAVKWMNENLSTSPGNRELARKAGMSLKSFYDTFRRDMGMTPKHYLFIQRMETARQQLLHSALSLEEIAELSGYADRFHFSKAFKQFCNLSPAAFRRKYGKKKMEK